MSIAEWEYEEVENYYQLGVISNELRMKLLDDICIILMRS